MSFALACFLFADALAAAVTQQQLAEVQHILQLYKANYDAIGAGAVLISGSRIQSDGREDYRGEIKAFMAFDKSKELLRYDYYEPGRTADGNPLPHGIGGNVIWTPSLTAYRSQGAGDLIQVHRTGMKPEQTPVADLLIYFDLIGFVANPDVLTFNVDFPTAASRELTLSNVSEFREDDEEITVTWTLPGSKRVVSFAKSHGLSPVRCQYFVGGQERLLASSTTEWKQKDGLWVPVQFVGEKFESNDNTTLSLIFRWESVNHISDLFVFSPESLKRNADAAMIDDRSGKPVVVGAPSRTYQDTTWPSKQGHGYVRLAVVLGNVLLVMVLVAMFVYFRRSRP